MTQSLTHIDSAFTNQYKSLLDIQQGIAEQLKQYRFDPEGNEITQAVYERMMAFWYFVACRRDVACRVSTCRVSTELVAVIELKVSDGWKGKTMINHLNERKETIWRAAEDRNVFFGAILFWNCFGKNGMAENNPNYIGLYHFKSDNNHVPTGQTIEQLVRAIMGGERGDADCTNAARRRDVACRVSTTMTTE